MISNSALSSQLDEPSKRQKQCVCLFIYFIHSFIYSNYPHVDVFLHLFQHPSHQFLTTTTFSSTLGHSDAQLCVGGGRVTPRPRHWQAKDSGIITQTTLHFCSRQNIFGIKIKTGKCFHSFLLGQVHPWTKRVAEAVFWGVDLEDIRLVFF